MRNKYFSILAFTVLIVLLTSMMALYAQGDAINTDALLHDSRDDLYRTPGGAAPFNTLVLLRLRAAANDLDSVNIRVYNTLQEAAAVVPMTVVATTPDGYDLWEGAIDVGEETTVLWYRFILTRGGQTIFYEDDTLPNGENYFAANEGGVGTVYTESPDLSYQIAVYDPEFYTPEWFRNAVVYQIFPDRFRNGDKTNDPSDGSDVFYGDYPLIFHETWNEPPVDGRRVQTPNGQGYFNSDFYGGDLAGITEKLEYLQRLGVTAIYLNPIFEARSNHRYDTADYLAIDPMLGTLEDFRTLVSEADALGMQIILDGVFNHMSSDSRYFDRYGRFDDVGACESIESDYRPWFVFVQPQAAQPSPCDGGEDGLSYYVSWAGFDSIPKINNNIFATRSFFIQGDDSVAATWGAEGIGGWRLDVAGDIDNGRDPDNSYWERFRRAVREINPETVIIGEEWNDATEWLLGDEWDTVMNYRYRRGIVGFVRGTDFVDNDGRISGLTVSQFDGLVRSVQEDYPPMAYYAMMNLLDSHDTSRLLFTLDNNRRTQQLAALIQFTLPGAPTVYYGDEIALDAISLPEPGSVTLQDDPYNRAPFPWDDEPGNAYPPADQTMFDYYAALAALRRQNPALSEGAMITLAADDATGLYAFLRVDRETENGVLVAANMGSEAQTATLNFQGLLPINGTMTSVFGSEAFSTGEGSAQITLPARTGDVWLLVHTEDNLMVVEPPARVDASGGAGQVTLNWSAVDDAAAYMIYRSPVASGGFEPILDLPVTQTTYVDETVTSGFVYYYAIASVNPLRVYGDLSESVMAVPSIPIDAAFYLGELPETVELAYGETVELQVGIRIEGVTEADGAAPGVRVNAGMFPTGTDLQEVNWLPMQHVGEQDGADVYSIALAPSQAGDFQLAAGVSTNAGQNFEIVMLDDDSFPTLTVEAGDDTTPPDAPATVNIGRASVTGVELEWEAVDDSGLSAYRVYRTPEDGETQLLAELAPDASEYQDIAVLDGQRFTYAVSAVDAGLNESALVETDEVLIERQLVPVTFVAEVPAATNSDVYIAGNFGTEQLPLWDPVGIVMEQLDDTHWAVTLNLPEGAALEYKFVRGTWDAVEKGTECEEIANRTLSINIDSLGELMTDIVPDGSYLVNHTIAKWRDLDACG
jgi:glycosidase/fibronectin type 3 domain-containing protein